MNSIFLAARDAWNAASTLRSSRARFKNYTYGRQWDDIVTAPDGRTMTEGEYARISGKPPLTNNMIRQLVKSIVSRFRYMLANEGDTAAELSSPALEAVAKANQLTELDCRLLEEYLISGCAIQRVVRERRPGGGDGVWVDNVSPAQFFVNRFTDPRGSDIQLIGMLHDYSLGEVMMRYSHGDPARAARLRDIYVTRDSLNAAGAPSQIGQGISRDFSRAEAGKCRVIEVWALESDLMLRCHDPRSSLLFTTSPSHAEAIGLVNESRRLEGGSEIVTDTVVGLSWHGYYFSPDGKLLDTTVSPYPHGGHPFVVKFYPFVDAEVHPFVEDIIDQQRYINRLITLIDHVMSFSAKGVLLFPQEQLPDGFTWEELGRRWCSTNGIIPYNGLPGTEPKQMYSGGNISGAQELLNIEMRLFEKISGVSSALQGEAATGNTSASLYESQIQNAAISLLDIMESFNAFRSQRNKLIIST